MINVIKSEHQTYPVTLCIYLSSSLIKMLYWLCEKSKIPGPPTWSQLEHAIRRNFGGLDDQDFDALEEFRKRIPNREDPDLTHIPPEVSNEVVAWVIISGK